MSKISPATERMSKSVTSRGTPSFNCGDEVAEGLAGQTLDVVKAIADDFGIDTDKHVHLNPGHQRMIMGNMIRKAIRVVDKVNAKVKAQAEKDMVDCPEFMTGSEVFAEILAKHRVEPKEQAEAA